jgi:copper oxidase (laccase) domain-containing protein
VDALTGSGVDPATLKAVICPSAGPCCYEVGPEVREAFATRFGRKAEPWFQAGSTRPHLDLWKAATDQLAARGVSAANIAIQGTCTICGSGFPSFRRQGAQAGRFAAIIGFQSPSA